MPVARVAIKSWWHVSLATHFLYGLQAAMKFTSGLISRPYTRLSHMTSLISPIASVVFASSKKRIVSIPFSLLILARSSASSTLFFTSCSVVPPWTYSRVRIRCTWQSLIWQYLHDEHVSDTIYSSTSTECYHVTHEPNETSFTTSCLTHHNHWYITPAEEKCHQKTSADKSHLGISLRHAFQNNYYSQK